MWLKQLRIHIYQHEEVFETMWHALVCTNARVVTTAPRQHDVHENSRTNGQIRLRDSSMHVHTYLKYPVCLKQLRIHLLRERRAGLVELGLFRDATVRVRQRAHS